MKPSEHIQPASYLQTHLAEAIRHVEDTQRPLILTQEGRAKVVMEPIETYEQTQEALALLKILALGNRQIDEGRIAPADEVFARIRSRGRAVV